MRRDEHLCVLHPCERFPTKVPGCSPERRGRAVDVLILLPNLHSAMQWKVTTHTAGNIAQTSGPMYARWPDECRAGGCRVIRTPL